MPTFIPPLKESIIFDASVAPLDATGKIVVITGTSTGLGLVAARTCALKGAAGIVLLNRPSERATDAHAWIAALAGPGTDVVSVPSNLASFQSVRDAMASVRRLPFVQAAGIDVRSLNAGVMGLADIATVDGFDLQMRTNFLADFLIVHERLAAARSPIKSLVAEPGLAAANLQITTSAGGAGPPVVVDYWSSVDPR